MVWEQKTSSVVMMTRLEERARIKCDQYWPSRSSESYGPITVASVEVQELATYCIRTFHVTKVAIFKILFFGRTKTRSLICPFPL